MILIINYKVGSFGTVQFLELGHFEQLLTGMGGILIYSVKKLNIRTYVTAIKLKFSVLAHLQIVKLNDRSNLYRRAKLVGAAKKVSMNFLLLILRFGVHV